MPRDYDLLLALLMTFSACKKKEEETVPASDFNFSYYRNIFLYMP
ncbi:hypothetical protein SAMN04487998_3457 [Hymenobacter actinosclerus]|uniref:Uncharacterized protein n=1 Tax=Hymenobacter actinosclerus TaxID=82805 RepID=A0A1I0IQV8_9BACT|nr:hypothetical protein SAMN04487998_3457 [Hymenobacter actinosclerus]